MYQFLFKDFHALNTEIILFSCFADIDWSPIIYTHPKIKRLGGEIGESLVTHPRSVSPSMRSRARTSVSWHFNQWPFQLITAPSSPQLTNFSYCCHDTDIIQFRNHLLQFWCQKIKLRNHWVIKSHYSYKLFYILLLNV